MKARDFLSQLEHDRIVGAIREAEQKTSGEIRVFISRKEPEDVVGRAQERFLKLGMEKTRERNAVLIYVAPRVKRFAVVGDTEVHARCGDEFWAKVTEEMSGHFKKQQFTQGIVHGIEQAGKLLAQHFPHRRDDKNELPDEVEHD